MPSPFPGMDPFIEVCGYWSDFHNRMNTWMCEEINEVLPKRYTAITDRYVWLHEPDAEERIRLGKPDVFLTERGVPQPRTQIQPAPQRLLLPASVYPGPRYVYIRDPRNRRIITVVELLSPSNKAAGPDREGYLTKRDEYRATGVNLVEIDLLRGGQNLPLGDPPPAPSDYYILVCRDSDFPRADYWPLSLRDSLPDVPIPLGPDEDDVLMPLRKCIDRVYDRGHYNDELNYTDPVTPALSDADAAWVRDILANRPTT